MMNIQIVDGICDFCNIEQKWGDAITKDLGPMSPADDPLWKRWEEAWARHNQRVVDLQYDDGGWVVCAKHLREMADMIDAATTA